MKKIQFNGSKNVVFALIKQHRLQNDFTQAQVIAKMQALGVNMDQQMLSKIEHNQRFVTDYELLAFCKILKIEWQELNGIF